MCLHPVMTSNFASPWVFTFGWALGLCWALRFVTSKSMSPTKLQIPHAQTHKDQPPQWFFCRLMVRKRTGCAPANWASISLNQSQLFPGHHATSSFPLSQPLLQFIQCRNPVFYMNWLHMGEGDKVVHSAWVRCLWYISSCHLHIHSAFQFNHFTCIPAAEVQNLFCTNYFETLFQDFVKISQRPKGAPLVGSRPLLWRF